MITYGKRIKYELVSDDGIYQSRTIFTDGERVVRVVVDKPNLQFKFVDPATGKVYFESNLKLTNYEVLQRHIKKELVKLLGIKFTKEERNVSKDE